jgi:hypothetical protein
MMADMAEAQTTTTLAEFLLARIDEDEAEQRWTDGRAFLEDYHGREWHRGECESLTDNAGPCDCGLPARVLAECAAKRRIVAGTWGRADDLPGVGEGMSRAFDFAAKMLAQPYADHPDFRDEWRL